MVSAITTLPLAKIPEDSWPEEWFADDLNSNEKDNFEVEFLVRGMWIADLDVVRLSSCPSSCNGNKVIHTAMTLFDAGDNYKA